MKTMKQYFQNIANIKGLERGVYGYVESQIDYPITLGVIILGILIFPLMIIADCIDWVINLKVK